ncbi:unnamed protein product [Linum tenue]|uniref:Uncharacterized protein n=1 Tax=Linum tenue TaxID=586396 RepID=A0AAV0MYV3_9ROSI|nr:unnamed protein product [Linum tenue]
MGPGGLLGSWWARPVRSWPGLIRLRPPRFTISLITLRPGRTNFFY